VGKVERESHTETKDLRVDRQMSIEVAIFTCGLLLGGNFMHEILAKQSATLALRAWSQLLLVGAC
jgi:hypothetical protein